MSRSREDLVKILMKKRVIMYSKRLRNLAVFIVIVFILGLSCLWYISSLETRNNHTSAETLISHNALLQQDINAILHVKDELENEKVISNAEDLHKKSSKLISIVENVYMDWLLPSDDFGYINYKSLESILVQYPEASVTVLLIGPQAADYYKCGDLLSKHYFQKYKKKGYAVKVKVVHDHPGGTTPGLAYWNTMSADCCHAATVSDFHTRIPVPYHLAAYSRIYSLYETGGLYTDFTWLHNSPIPLRIDRGVLIRKKCSHDFEDSVVTSLCVRCPNTASRCYTSSLYIFRGRHDPVLACLLREYDTSSSILRECIVRDESSAIDTGASCIREAFARCFSDLGLRNQLAELPQFVEAFEWDDDGQAGVNRTHWMRSASSSASSTVDLLWGRSADKDNAVSIADEVHRLPNVLWLGRPSSTRYIFSNCKSSAEDYSFSNRFL